MNNWERFHIQNHENLYRLKVPGGWLVRYADTCRSSGNTIGEVSSICFYPDPKHEWSWHD